MFRHKQKQDHVIYVSKQVIGLMRVPKRTKNNSVLKEIIIKPKTKTKTLKISHATSVNNQVILLHSVQVTTILQSLRNIPGKIKNSKKKRKYVQNVEFRVDIQRTLNVMHKKGKRNKRTVE